HYPLLSHCRAATEIFNLQTRGKTKAWATSGYELIQEEIPEAGDHAAAWETSLMLYFRPELVDMEQLPESEKKSLIGVMGRDPRKHASSELGKKGVKLIIDKIDTKIKNIFDKME
ncbi:MAG: creatininase family protein, partial [Halanaerobiaceae bacterium]